ncbi:MAG: capsular biosynthesis protein, partial [Betaproteobacteria bacterium]
YYINTFLDQHSITDVVLLGEQRALHRVAIEAAKERFITVTVTDFGYIRPDWVIVELNGMNADSLFPRDPQAIHALAKDLPPVERAVIYRDGFFSQAMLDMTFHLSSALFPWTFPYFKRHTLQHPITNYLGIGRRLVLAGVEERRTRKVLEQLSAVPGLKYIFAMQTEDDYSLRAYSHYANLDTPMREAIQSFARHAPPDSVLIFKVHPLDPELKNWRSMIERMANEAGVGRRVIYIDGGDLDKLIATSAGVVTVNSTVGLRAIELGLPILALGQAIYRIHGLTHEAGLDDFWINGCAPEPSLANAFLRALAATLHVRGSYYTREGVRAAAEGMAYRLHHNLVNQPLPAVLRGETLSLE